MKKRVLAVLTAMILLLSSVQVAYADMETVPETTEAVSEESGSTVSEPETVPDETEIKEEAGASADSETESTVQEPEEGTSAQDPEQEPAGTPDGQDPEDAETPDEETADPAEEAEPAEEVPADGLLEAQEEPEEEIPEPEVYVDIEDGYYTINSVLSEKAVLDVDGAKRDNKANIQLFTANNTPGQVFRVIGTTESYETYNIVEKEVPVLDEEGNETGETKTVKEKEPVIGTRRSYVLEPYSAPGKALDIVGGRRTNRTNVQQYTANGTNAQKWYFVESPTENYVTIKSAISTETVSFALDAAGASAANKTNIQIYRANGTNAQLWRFNRADLYEPENGLYRIVTEAGTKVMNVANNSPANKANVNVAAKKEGSSQIFYLKKAGFGGYYTIMENTSRKDLDVSGGKRDVGTNIQIYNANTSDAQLFRFVPKSTKEDGSVVFWMQFKTGNAKVGLSGSNVQIAQSASGWYLEKASDEEAVKPVSDGIYNIVSKQNTSRQVDIAGGSLTKKALAQIFQPADTNAQRFRITATEDGFYKITALQSGMMLNVAGAKAKDGTTVWQYPDDGTKAVLWRIEPTGDGDGSVYLAFHTSDHNLDLTDGKTSNRTKLVLNQATDKNRQKFYLVRTETKTGWQNYYGKYRYVYNGNGDYYTNTVVDGARVGADGTMDNWFKVDGYWRKKLSDGSYASDSRPYLAELYGTTTVDGYTAPNVPAYRATIDRYNSSRGYCLVTFYTKFPGTDEWNVPVCAFKCCPGLPGTPTTPGERYTVQKKRWSELMGPSYGQYSSRLSPGEVGELFHSVACSYMNDHCVNPNTYNKLGQKASHGCVRLSVRNAYWIWRFCPLGMGVYVGDNLPSPIPACPQPKMRGGSVDPTDPAYTGNYGYTDTNNYYGSYYF